MKYFLFATIAIALQACAQDTITSEPENVISPKTIEDSIIIDTSGMTLETRFNAPIGFRQNLLRDAFLVAYQTIHP